MDTPPDSSTSSSASSPSPLLEPSVKAELTFDDMTFTDNRTDPLEFLLQTLSGEPADSTSPQDTHSQEWSQMASWDTSDNKFTLGSDFDFSIPMELDFQSNMAVDPSALHFNPSMFTHQASVAQSEHLFNAHTNAQFPTAPNFPFDPQNGTWTETSTQRRLSITSASSSSGASLSPIPEHSSAISSSASDSGYSEGDSASELAHRVRQMAGVTLAVPVSAQVQQLAAAGGQAKLPIPRLPRPTSTPIKRAPSKASSPEAGFSSSASASPSAECSDPIAEAGQATDISQPALTASGRPKTSHTTIERRYRTNLNARITGLKQAVPALRVLEKNGSSYGDAVDTRGFVDGVKVARKMSKANVLGKATEYIKVLKRREARLTREQDGLKSLIAGLVGGPALLKEWEREWREKFGGSEKDELEDGMGSAAASDDEDGDGEDSDEEGDDGRAKKKAKVVKPPKKEKIVRSLPAPTVPAAPGAVPEKRKRGRPRKNPLPPVPPITALSEPSPMVLPNPSQTGSPAAHPMQAGNHPEAQPAPQYLLAAFAFFSIFNSPLASSYTRSQSHSHGHHHGMVMTDHPVVPIPQPSSSAFSVYGYSTHDMVQAFHLLVSTAVLFYIVLPWFSGALQRNSITSFLKRLPSYLLRASQPSRKAPAHGRLDVQKQVKVEHNRSALNDALDLSRRGASDEATQLREALGISTGVIGLMQSVIKAARIDRGIELNQLEQRAWVRLGELVALDSTTSKATRLQTYWCMSWHIPTFKASTTDLSTLALIVRPASHSKASELWEQARQHDALRMHERVVLSTMSVDEASDILDKWRLWRAAERKTRCAACEKRTPLGILAAIIVRFKLRKHAASMFVRTVAPHGARDEDGEEVLYDAEQEQKDEQEMRGTIEAAKSIGGRTAELAGLLERAWDSGFCPEEDVLSSSRPKLGDHDDEHCEEEHDLADLDAQEIRSLISATLIYRHIFPSSFPSVGPSVSLILSPPPSPSRKNVALHTALRTALGSAAFDYVEGRLDDPTLGGALEDARDRVVDILPSGTCCVHLILGAVFTGSFCLRILRTKTSKECIPEVEVRVRDRVSATAGTRAFELQKPKAYRMGLSVLV
ncbi:hypothetical protein EIP91_009585 [Steccherinum ochraceum]|uniref:BHLH domain-containing protein n=1 Tax=Steccherinum ochraceum TaxID=92696 RepID=A0A4R0RJP8_9APHY|nr:hypothetical protein EIP91_009585 [Steccherinum ochraceum]